MKSSNVKSSNIVGMGAPAKKKAPRLAKCARCGSVGRPLGPALLPQYSVCARGCPNEEPLDERAERLAFELEEKTIECSDLAGEVVALEKERDAGYDFRVELGEQVRDLIDRLPAFFPDCELPQALEARIERVREILREAVGL